MPWQIAEGDLEQITRQSDLVALVRSRGINLAKHGTTDFIGRCPFHDDQHEPSFMVMPQKRSWECMACGKSGNVIQFVQHYEGVSFRHAFELLRTDGKTAFPSAVHTAREVPLKKSTVPRLPCPLNVEADDSTLLSQVAAYYHERLKQSAPARAFLALRGLDRDDLINRFQIGFADRTLGLRLPEKNRKDGKQLRSRLTQLGLWRGSGHEHYNGCIVVPLHGEQGPIAGFYGRRVSRPTAMRGGLQHLYPAEPQLGRFNRSCLDDPEIILCGTVFDALTFWANGFRNVTCFTAEVFPDDLWVTMKKVQRIRLAYSSNESGERAAQQHAEQFQARGIEVFRIRFPQGMNANEYASRFKPADKSLALLVNAAQWLGPGFVAQVALLPQDSKSYSENGAGPKAAGSHLENFKPIATSGTNPTGLEQRGDAWFLALERREYRVVGLDKTTGPDALKIGLRLRFGDRFHLDQLDLGRDMERRRFVERAAEETGLTVDLLKRDLGKLLLAVEQTQADLSKPQISPALAVILSPEEREEALAWLRAPNLVGRLREAFRQAGIIGEENNTLVAYLAGVSRKLEQPLAVIIQSASAAGKTTLMDAVLSFFPEEERVKYSAMTGQSLYYLGETSLKHKILAVVEEGGAQKATYALKLLQSEGELTIASTGKDPTTGRLVTQEYHIAGPVMIFLTTTAIDLAEELQNRCLILAVDESSEQTGRIHHLQRERRTLAGLIAKAERQDVLKKLRNTQRLLQTVDVLNPYAPSLTFATARTRNRRDHEKYLTLIDAIALLHQHQRRRGQHIVNGRSIEFIEATLDDIALANQLAPEVLGRSLDELPPQTRRAFGFIRELMKQKRKERGARNATTFSRKELRDACGWSLTQVSVHLERLVALEYLALRHARFGSPFVYEILFDLDAPEAVAHVGLIEVAQLRRDYTAKVTAFSPGVPGQNGRVTGGVETTPTPVLTNADAVLAAR